MIQNEYNQIKVKVFEIAGRIFVHVEDVIREYKEIQRIE